MVKKVKRIIIDEDSGGYCGARYFSKMKISNNSILYNEKTENYSMFYPERDYAYNYRIISKKYTDTFNNLANKLIQIYKEIIDNKRFIFECTDCGINTITIVFEDNSKLKLDFYCSLYENDFDEIAEIILSMIPPCEHVPSYLIMANNEEND